MTPADRRPRTADLIHWLIGPRTTTPPDISDLVDACFHARPIDLGRERRRRLNDQLAECFNALPARPEDLEMVERAEREAGANVVTFKGQSNG